MNNESERARAQDELPQSAAGRTIMTTEPKFVPNQAATINVDEGLRSEYPLSRLCRVYGSWSKGI